MTTATYVSPLTLLLKLAPGVHSKTTASTVPVSVCQLEQCLMRSMGVWVIFPCAFDSGVSATADCPRSSTTVTPAAEQANCRRPLYLLLTTSAIQRHARVDAHEATALTGITSFICRVLLVLLCAIDYTAEHYTMIDRRPFHCATVCSPTRSHTDTMRPPIQAVQS